MHMLRIIVGLVLLCPSLYVAFVTFVPPIFRAAANAYMTTQVEELTKADVENDTGYKTNERARLSSMCTTFMRKQFDKPENRDQLGALGITDQDDKLDDYCECVADRADEAMTHYNRLFIFRSYQDRMSGIHDLESKLDKLGLEDGDVSKVLQQNHTRFNDLMRRCSERVFHK